MKKIILTGGGTAGHVTPNLALLPTLKAEGFEVHYIGSKNGPEMELAKSAGITNYHAISAGKLRRYIDLRNVTDIFRVIKGLGDAIRVIRRVKPDIIFSKGGFVTVPVLAAAKLLRVRSVTHESDITPGLANRLSQPFVRKICVSFPETLTYLPERKSVLTGTPIRQELLQGNRQKGLQLCKWPESDKPVVLVTGGSQGANAINACVREALPKLTKKFKIIHLCGKGNLSGISLPGYAEFEYVQDGLADLYALADITVSRAGANTIFELLALRMPNLLIPLTKEVSRGDQILNAESFALQGFSMILPEGSMTTERLLKDIDLLYNEREIFITNMATHKQADGVSQVMNVIKDAIKVKNT